MVYRRGSVEGNIRLIVSHLEIKNNEARTYTELAGWVKESGVMTERQLQRALTKAVGNGTVIHPGPREFYFLPGNVSYARRRQVYGSLGSDEKLVLINEAFHEIFTLRLTENRDGKHKLACRIADRIEPLLRAMREADANFPYSPGLHECLRAYPHGNDHYSSSQLDEHMWVSYCASVLEYCNRGPRQCVTGRSR